MGLGFYFRAKRLGKIDGFFDRDGVNRRGVTWNIILIITRGVGIRMLGFGNDDGVESEGGGREKGSADAKSYGETKETRNEK